MLWRAFKLRKLGVLGLNRRNSDYVMRYNERRYYPFADDKLRTKSIAIAAGIAVPDLYGVITTQREIRRLPEMVEGRDGFVIKPACGSGGNGVLVLSRRGETFRRPDGRIIVFLGYPVMAMVRLPTRASAGKANLHQGAIGVGINLTLGETLQAVSGTEFVNEHPDTLNPIAGIKVPGWETILTLAAGTYELTKLGYMGVDIVLDRDRGPLILELNARPGLNIQLANRVGLQGRLRAIEAVASDVRTPAERAAFAREQFA